MTKVHQNLGVRTPNHLIEHFMSNSDASAVPTNAPLTTSKLTHQLIEGEDIVDLILQIPELDNMKSRRNKSVLGRCSMTIHHDNRNRPFQSNCFSNPEIDFATVHHTEHTFGLIASMNAVAL